MAITARPEDVEFYRRLLQSTGPTEMWDGGYSEPAWAKIPNSVPQQAFSGFDSALSGVLNNEDYADPRELLYRLLQSGQITPEEAAVYMSRPKQSQVDWEKANSLAGMLSGDYSQVADKAGQSQEAIKGQIAGDLQRYGINDPSQLAAQTTSLGDTIFYNKETGQVVPTRFGSDMSGEDGRYFSLGLNPDGSVGINANQRTSSDWGDVRGAMIAMAPIAAGYGLSALGVGEAAPLGGEAFNASIGPTAGQAFSPTGAGLAGGEATLGSGTFGLESLYGGTMGLSEGSLAAGGGVAGLAGMGGSGPLALNNIISGAGPAAGAALGSSAASNILPSSPRVGLPGTGSGGGGMGGDIMPLLAALYGANDSSFTDKLEQIANTALERGDPFGPERPYYQGKLKETFENPQAVYDRDYTALDQTFFNELMAQDAARGRSTDSYKRGVEREAKFQDWMTGHRGQLGGFAGANIDPSRMAGQYMEGMGNMAAIQQMNRMAPFNAVGQFLGGNDGLQLGDITGGLSNLWDWGSSLFKG